MRLTQFTEDTVTAQKIHNTISQTDLLDNLGGGVGASVGSAQIICEPCLFPKNLLLTLLGGAIYPLVYSVH